MFSVTEISAYLKIIIIKFMTASGASLYGGPADEASVTVTGTV